jgi:hypothetical protein
MRAASNEPVIAKVTPAVTTAANTAAAIAVNPPTFATTATAIAINWKK